MKLRKLRKRLLEMQERVIADGMIARRDRGKHREQCLRDAETLETAAEQVARLGGLEE